MKKIILPLLLWFLGFQTNGQQTTVYITGTIHNGNKKFDHRTLFRKIKALDPDVILWEQSTPFKRVFGLLTARALRIWNPGIEQLALQRYTRKHPSCPVLPFDIEIPDRKSYLREMDTRYDALFRELDGVKLPAEDSLQYAVFSKSRANYYNSIVDMTLEEINKPETWQKAGDLFQAETTILASLVKKYSTDTTLVNWHQRECNFWIQRNDFMSDQILHYAKANPGKKILVLTGLNHKYYLVKKVKEQSGQAIRLHEQL